MEDDSFGFSLVTYLCEPEEIEQAFFENARCAEYAYRIGSSGRKRPSLKASVAGLLRELQPECRLAVADDQSWLIREIVAARNWFAHGNYDLPKPSAPRLLGLSLKLGALLFLIEIHRRFGPDAARRGALSFLGNARLRSAMAVGTTFRPAALDSRDQREH